MKLRWSRRVQSVKRLSWPRSSTLTITSGCLSFSPFPSSRFWPCAKHPPFLQTRSLTTCWVGMCFDSVVGCVSGDGTLHEIFNGFARRPDARNCLRLPVVPVPCGAYSPSSITAYPVLPEVLLSALLSMICRQWQQPVGFAPWQSIWVQHRTRRAQPG